MINYLLSTKFSISYKDKKNNAIYNNGLDMGHSKSIKIAPFNTVSYI